MYWLSDLVLYCCKAVPNSVCLCLVRCHIVSKTNYCKFYIGSVYNVFRNTFHWTKLFLQYKLNYPNEHAICRLMQTSSLNIWPTVLYRSMIWTAVLFTLKMFFCLFNVIFNLWNQTVPFFAKLLSSFTLSKNQPSTELFSTLFFYFFSLPSLSSIIIVNNNNNNNIV